MRLCLSYDGTHFYGWQKQSPLSLQPTVQGLLEGVLSEIFNQEISVVGSGRTDRGVHALNQWAHCDLPELEKFPWNELAYKLERMTPPSVAIRCVEQVPHQFHAQISALSKTYTYRFFVKKVANPFVQLYSWHYVKKMDLSYLRAASELLLGEHDFSSFQSRGAQTSSTVRCIYHCRWKVRSRGFVDFQIRGSGFLKQMVRNLVGTLMWHQDRGSRTQKIQEILESGQRSSSGPPAPARGLFLSSVQYPKELDSQCQVL